MIDDKTIGDVARAIQVGSQSEAKRALRRLCEAILLEVRQSNGQSGQAQGAQQGGHGEPTAPEPVLNDGLDPEPV